MKRYFIQYFGFFSIIYVFYRAPLFFLGYLIAAFACAWLSVRADEKKKVIKKSNRKRAV